MRIIGIDLGTTNSVVAYVDENGEAHAIADETGSRITPSVIYFHPGVDKMDIGEMAVRHAVIEPERVARLFKRGMGEPHFQHDARGNPIPFTVDGRELRPEVLSSFVIRKMVTVAKAHLGEPITDVVVTVPAYFGESRTRRHPSSR